MDASTEIDSRTKFRRLCRTAGVSLLLLLFALYLIFQQTHGATVTGTSAKLAPSSLAFVVLAFLIEIGFGWGLDRLIEGQRFPIVDKLFGFLPWLYSCVLGIAVISAFLGLLRGFTNVVESSFLLSISFVWLSPSGFQLLRLTAGLTAVFLCIATWWTTSNASYLALAFFGMGAAFTTTDSFEPTAGRDQ